MSIDRDTEKELEKSKQVTLQDLYKDKRNKTLICHLMIEKRNEVASVKKKIYDLDFIWNKRIYPIDHSAVITDKKGISHYYHDVNETTGTLRFDKSYMDKCIDCGKKIGIDAMNARDLLKRKTISAIWGIDQTHVLLLLIMGVVLVAMIGITFYIYGDNQKLQEKLETYLPKPTVTQQNSNGSTSTTTIPNGGSITTTHMLIGVAIFQ